MLIGFKDDKDGFYQIETDDENFVPEWAKDMKKLTEEERLASLVKEQE